jgi:anti-sigma B factor antagonist
MADTNAPFIVQTIDKFAVVEFRGPSLMDALELERVSEGLIRLVEVEDRRRIVLDFEKVQFISSQMVGILVRLHKLTSAAAHGKLVLCGLGPKLIELLKITRLDRMLTIKPSQREAIKVFT